MCKFKLDIQCGYVYAYLSYYNQIVLKYYTDPYFIILYIEKRKLLNTNLLYMFM